MYSVMCKLTQVCPIRELCLNYSCSLNKRGGRLQAYRYSTVLQFEDNQLRFPEPGTFVHHAIRLDEDCCSRNVLEFISEFGPNLKDL